MTGSYFYNFVSFVQSLTPLVFWMLGIVIGTASVACCYFGVNALYRSRLMADMPTSKLRSAAQGYIEVQGWAQMMPGEPIYAPLSGMPCVWYSYKVEETGDSSGGGRGWTTLESGVSDAIFYLVDQTGKCVIDPDGAEVTPSVKVRWRGNTRRPMIAPKKTSVWSMLFHAGSFRFTECRIHEYDPLYAIGQFTGVGGSEQASIKEATGDLLSLWKRDRGGLLQRFDANRDGQIDLDEWENVRLAAEKQAISNLYESQQHPEINLLKKPADGRTFIISSSSQDHVIAVNRRKAVLGIVGFLGFGLALAWSVKQRFG